MTLTSSGNETDSIPATMNAYRVNGFGPPEVIRRETIPTPMPGPGEVLVKVEAAG